MTSGLVEMIEPLRLTQALVDKLPRSVSEEGPVLAASPHPEFYTETAADILAKLHNLDELWVFVIGSLIWNSRFEVVERRRAHVKGWRRSCHLGPTQRFRGSPSAPGRILSLDRGGECQGIVMRM
jgi:cation transport protein ChaC